MLAQRSGKQSGQVRGNIDNFKNVLVEDARAVELGNFYRVRILEGGYKTLKARLLSSQKTQL